MGSVNGALQSALVLSWLLLWYLLRTAVWVFAGVENRDTCTEQVAWKVFDGALCKEGAGGHWVVLKSPDRPSHFKTNPSSERRSRRPVSGRLTCCGCAPYLA